MSQKWTATNCTATKKDGKTRCKAWAVRGSDPPRCAAHGGGKASVGAPPGNQNALKHGFYAGPAKIPVTISDAIKELATKLAWLSQYFDTHQDDFTIEQVVTLLTLHGINLSRFGRLLRDRHALSGEAADGMAGAIALALNELSTQLGVDLGAPF